MTDSCAKFLAEKQLTVVFIESATAGYLAHRFSMSPYSGDVLMGGLMTLKPRRSLSVLFFIALVIRVKLMTFAPYVMVRLSKSYRA